MLHSAARAVKRYSLTHSVVSPRITPEAVWALWADVNNWPRWDKGLDSCNLQGDFSVGRSFALRPKGAPMDLTTTLIEAVPNSHFKDSTQMPLGTIEVTHKVENTDEGFRVTHTIEADVFEDKIPAFESTLLAKWQVGLPNSVENIVGLAEELSLAEEKREKPKPGGF